MAYANFGGMSGLPNDLGDLLDLEHATDEVTNSKRSVELLIPLKYGKGERKALPNILTTLNDCTYIQKVNFPVVATGKEYNQIKSLVKSKLDLSYIITKCNSNPIKEIMNKLRADGANLPLDRNEKLITGKGRDVWLGLMLTTSEADVTVIHDADITPDTYDCRIPTLLAWPLTASDKDFQFSKGFYPRIDKNRKVHGRVCTDFMGPFLDSLYSISGGNEKSYELLRYLKAFPYPLSGEFAITSNLARNCTIKPRYGLEMGLLKEVFRNTNPEEEVFHVGLLKRMDHYHQSNDDLGKMINEITKTTFKSLIQRNPSIFAGQDFNDLAEAYRFNARKSVERWDNIIHMVNLKRKRSTADKRVNTFYTYFRTACKEWQKGDRGADELPTIESVNSHMPDIAERLKEISDEGN